MGDHDNRVYKAPDGGYGWVIVFCSFMLQAISGGIAFSVGIYFVEFLDTFGRGTGATAWIGSINSGLLFGAGKQGSMVGEFRANYLNLLSLLSSDMLHLGPVLVSFNLLSPLKFS